MTVSEILRSGKIDYGQLVTRNKINVLSFSDNRRMSNTENIPRYETGLVVDYLTRLMCGVEKKEVFELSLRGALKFYNKVAKTDDIKRLGELLYNLKRYYQNIKALDNTSIKAACNMVKYDVCYRHMPDNFVECESKPDGYTIANIRNMVYRTLDFLKAFGPVINYGGIVRLDKAKIISSGRYDCVTKEGLYDFKSLSGEPTDADYMQVFIYYLMGLLSNTQYIMDISKLGIFNPRKNKLYTIYIKDIPVEKFDFTTREVIGYTQ